jgi:Flp pilus assembly protein TadG
MQILNPRLETKIKQLRADDGQSLVEFAFALPFLCLIILAFVDFGRAVNTWLTASHTASEAARIAAVYGSQGDCSALVTKIKTFSGTSGTVQISFPSGTSAVGDPVRVTVNKTYAYAPSGLIPGSWNIAGSATMRLEQKPTFAACSA